MGGVNAKGAAQDKAVSAAASVVEAPSPIAPAAVVHMKEALKKAAACCGTSGSQCA